MEEWEDPRIKERFTVVPEPAGGWSAVASALARKIADLVTDDPHHWCFVLGVDADAAHRLDIEWVPWDVRVQIHEDVFDPMGRKLAPHVTERMLADGWGPPDHFDGFHPGWWRHYEPPFDFESICGEAIDHYSTGFDFPPGTSTILEVIQWGELQ